MKKIYFLILFTASIFSGFASNANQNYMHSMAEKHIERIKNIVKTNAENLPLKSVQADEKKLDSIVYDNGSSKLFFYNENGQITDFKSYVVDWDDEPAELKEHQHFEYDASGNNTLHILYYLDSFDGWIEKQKYEYKYDAAGNLIEEIYWDYSHNEMTNPVSKNSYLYDGNNITVNNYSWIEADEDWKLTEYSTLETDGDGNILSGEGYVTSEDTGEMFKAAIIEYEYDAAGRQLSESTKIFYPEQDQWIDVMLTEYEYNNDGELILERGKTYANGDTAAWFGYEDRYVYEEGKLVRKEEYGKMGADELYLAWYDEYIYDGDILSSKKQYFYEATSEEMKLQEKIDYSFISGVDADDYLLPEIDPYYDDNSVYSYEVSSFGVLSNLTRYNIPWDSEELTVDYEATYYYSEGGSSVVLSSDANLSAIEIDGTSLDGFMAGNHTYEVVLPAGTETPPVVTATTSHSGASANINQANDLPGEATITVMAEDGETSVQYTIQFTISVGVQALRIPNIEVYPMPFSNYIELNNKADNKLKSFEIFTLDGKSIKSGKIAGETEKYSIETAELGTGVYILNLIFENEQLFYQRVVKQ